jgi:hypothetical protein
LTLGDEDLVGPDQEDIAMMYFVTLSKEEEDGMQGDS